MNRIRPSLLILTLCGSLVFVQAATPAAPPGESPAANTAANPGAQTGTGLLPLLNELEAQFGTAENDGGTHVAFASTGRIYSLAKESGYQERRQHQE